MVNSVLSNIPLYFLSIYRAPKWVVRRIEALRWAFFWKGGTSVRGGQCLVQWKSVCRSKKDGGLGVLDLASMNAALLAKWWWKLLAEQKNLWRPIILGHYYSRRKPLKEGASFRPVSFWWRNVLTTREVFKCGVYYSIGDGLKADWWNDIWCGHAPLRTAYPLIFDKVRTKTCRVRDCWGSRGWKWRKILAGFVPDSQAERDLRENIVADVNAIPLSDDKDEVRWRWDNSGRFSVRSLYKFLQDGGVPERRWSQLWSISTPLKVKIFVWLVLKGRVLTADNLFKRGWNGEGRCALCTDDDETIGHLFLECPRTKDLLNVLLPNKRTASLAGSPEKLWANGSLKRGVLGRRELGTIAITWWAVWLERNRIIFETKKKMAKQLLVEIK